MIQGVENVLIQKSEIQNTFLEKSYVKIKNKKGRFHLKHPLLQKVKFFCWHPITHIIQHNFKVWNYLIGIMIKQCANIGTELCMIVRVSLKINQLAKIGGIFVFRGQALNMLMTSNFYENFIFTMFSHNLLQIKTQIQGCET